ncbi:MAG: PD40 domain-containing protein, partial [Gemmataceae bacterium]|nr:PD40 domain-containing protein [Gemmataceae bacterium]
MTVLTLDGGAKRVVYSAPRRFEAPNWSPDGKYLLLNSEGKLWRLPLAGGEAELVNTGKVTGINNDHGISPDGKLLAISAGQIYVL